VRFQVNMPGIRNGGVLRPQEVLLHPSVYPPDEPLLARIVARWHELQKRTNQFHQKLKAIANEVRKTER
jgi:hypothetical protein